MIRLYKSISYIRTFPNKHKHGRAEILPITLYYIVDNYAKYMRGLFGTSCGPLGGDDFAFFNGHRCMFTEAKFEELPEEAISNLTNLEYIQLRGENKCYQRKK